MKKSIFKKESFSAGGIVLNTQGQIALVLMDNGKWSFPKGHIEKNESTLEAAKREIHEETGIEELKLIKELGGYQRESADDKNEIKNITLFLFRTSETDMSPSTNDIIRATWVNKEDVTSILSFKEDREFFEKIKDSTEQY